MEATEKEKFFYGSNVYIVKRDQDESIYKLEDDTGSTILTSYNVFEGVEIIYNDVHMQSVYVDKQPPEGFFEINHCREGRIECEYEGKEYLYMAKDDVVINRKDSKVSRSYFPLSHYHGVTICLEVSKAQRQINKYLPNSNINLEKLFNKLCNNKSFMIMKANENIGHIFTELYSVPESIKLEYYKIKVLEIVLFLSALNGFKNEERQYYSKAQVDKVKDIHRQITENIQHKHTLEELAKNNNISLTTMKKYFKGIYGQSIYAYLREYRIKVAAEKLAYTNENILSIANYVGYENGSKFAAAFKDIVGVSPKEFRAKRDMMSIWS